MVRFNKTPKSSIARLIDELPFYYAKMLRKREQIPNWYKLVAEELDWQEEILEIAKANKEISVKDVSIPDNFPKFTGWTHAPKRMLDYLSTRGFLFSSKREKFQSFYKLPDDFKPESYCSIPEILEAWDSYNLEEVVTWAHMAFDICRKLSNRDEK